MAASEKSIWTKLAELPDEFPDNGKEVKNTLRNYYKEVDYKSESTISAASEFLKGITLEEIIEALRKVVYGDIHIKVPKTNGIYRGSYELSKKVFQSPEFLKGMTPEDRKKAILAIFSGALTGHNNSALQAMKEAFEKGNDTGHEDSKFIYFCTAIRGLFLVTLFVDERARVTGHPNWLSTPEATRELMLQKMPEPILNNSECEEVIAELIPLFYPDKTADDYYQAIEILNLQKKKIDDEKISAGKENPKSTNKPPKESRFLTFEGDFGKTKRKRNIPSVSEKANAQTPLIAPAKKPLSESKTVKRGAKREEEDKSQEAEVQNSSTNKKLKIGFMGGLVTLGIGIGLLFVPGLQVIGIGFIVVGASVAIKTADKYIEENKKAKAQQHSREDKEVNTQQQHREDKKTKEQHPRVRNDRKSQKENEYKYPLRSVVSDYEESVPSSPDPSFFGSDRRSYGATGSSSSSSTQHSPKRGGR